MKTQQLIIVLGLGIITVFAACSKQDDFKKYTEKGETLYTGKLDSPKIASGRLRLKVSGILPADPKITKCKLKWNGGKDSIIYNISKSSTIDTFSRIIAVPEGLQNFSFQTYDAAGNASLITTATGIAYGPKYESGLINRPVANAELLTNGNAAITWGPFDLTTGAKATLVKYTKANNLADSVLVPVSQAVTTLPTYKPGSSITIKTQYLPTPTSIDYFYAKAETVNVSYDVTSLYFKNAGNPFTNSSNAGRWGILNNWTTTANVKNHGNYGGWCADQGGCISMEMGWDGTAKIVNGKIYQTFTLPAGNYSFEITMGKNEALDPVYIAAAEGNTLPDVANITTSLGYTNFANNAFQFKLSDTKTVSIGFVTSMTTDNQYWVVKAVKLKSI